MKFIHLKTAPRSIKLRQHYNITKSWMRRKLCAWNLNKKIHWKFILVRNRRYRWFQYGIRWAWHYVLRSTTARDLQQRCQSAPWHPEANALFSGTEVKALNKAPTGVFSTGLPSKLIGERLFGRCFLPWHRRRTTAGEIVPPNQMNLLVRLLPKKELALVELDSRRKYEASYTAQLWLADHSSIPDATNHVAGKVCQKMCALLEQSSNFGHLGTVPFFRLFWSE